VSDESETLRSLPSIVLPVFSLTESLLSTGMLRNEDQSLVDEPLCAIVMAGEKTIDVIKVKISATLFPIAIRLSPLC